MNILITDEPSGNGYIESLILGYKRAGHTVICGYANFFYSDFIPDVVHIHWAERLYDWHRPGDLPSDTRLILLKERLAWFRAKNVPIVYTVHNLNPHENNDQLNSRAAFSEIISSADLIVHHCKQSIQLLQAKYPASEGKKHVVCPHGDYLIHFEEKTKKSARKHFGIPEDKLVILNFGNQRPYKNDVFFHKAFSKCDIDNKYLLVAGAFYNDPSKGLLGRVKVSLLRRFREKFAHSNKKYLYHSFKVDEISSVLRCADVIFIAQTKSLNSGVIPLAATFSIPVVFARTGCFIEAAEGWAHETYEPNDLAGAAQALKRASEVDVNAVNNNTWLLKNSWDSHVSKILSSIN